MIGSTTNKRQCPTKRGADNEQLSKTTVSNSGADAVLTSQGQQVKSRRVCRQRRLSASVMCPAPTVPVTTASPTLPLELPKPTFCRHCFAKKFAFETKNFCCGDGKMRIVTNEWPPELKHLYTSTDEDALHFQKYARIYNNLFAFSSIGGGLNADTKKGIYVFRLQGQLYHFVPNLIPSDGTPKYLQLYFYDAEHEKENRLGQLPNLRPDIMERLMTIMQAASNARGKRGTMICCRDYYAYKLQIRPGNHLLRSCRLFQQFIVDMYVKLENTRLDFFRQNQKLIRADLYQGILDSLLIGEQNANNVGHRVVLPPTFIGGPRDMKRRYLNAMALVQRYGKPDIFLTMTCNPKWKEIEAELEVGEKVENRPDLVARIFRAKLMVLRKKIMEEEFFGLVAGMIYVVEFQKRGLPHVHFLIILERPHKIKSPEQFDKFVCAEIPSEENPYLRSLVLKHMMHGPCGSMFPDCPCMQQKGNVKRCRSNYPKSHVEVTSNNSDGYPLYRRRQSGETVTVRKFAMDNQWVIPYNAELLAQFDCHINVEVCSTITAVKYLYKYVYKGHDKVSFALASASADNQVDEIHAFQSGRWVSPPEAAWRLFGFDLYDMVPSVLPLQVHLPNQQCVSFPPNETVQYIARSSHRYDSQLTAFFKMNAMQSERSKLLYSHCPEQFVWNKEQKKWTPRIGRVQVGRLVFVSPGEGERYFLRLLLCHVPGPRSFDDLLTVHGTRCQSFKEAAIKRGLVEADDAIDQCFKEAVEFQMPKAFRQLFATILVFSQPAQPRTLWEKYFNALSEDFRHAYPDDQRKILHLTCKDIEQMMKPCGKSFVDFDLPDLQQIAQQEQNLTCSREVIDALIAPVPQNFVGMWKKLNTEQRQAYKSIIRCVKEKKAAVFFIDGPGGTGKTFLYCAIYAKIRLMDNIVVVTASSGIAASNIPSGRTAHSRFKIPLDADDSLSCGVAKQSDLAQLLRESALIIWDEASMARKENVEAVD